MRLASGVSAWRARPLLAGLCAMGSLMSGGCTPEEVTEPEGKIDWAVAPTSGLVGEWKLDETSGTIAVDTKNGYNATVLGGAAFVAGKLGNALNFDNGTAGTGGKHAQMPSNATLDAVQEGNYTISAWFYPYTNPTNDTVDNRNWAIVVKYGQHMGLVYETGQKFSARHYLTGDVQLNAASSATYALNTWHHVASVVSKTGGSVKLYVNGALAATKTFTANTAAREYGTRPFRIGRAQYNWAANGKVDQVRIYNRDLSATEVSDLFNETAGTAPTVTTNAATAVKTTSATLNGSADPNGASTTGWFRYSATNPGSCNDTFGTRSPSTGGTSLGSGTAPVSYNRGITNLTGGKVYYFCAIASNSAGTAFGTVQSFRAGGLGLRFALMGNDTVGIGPGGDFSGPTYRALVDATPLLSTIDAQIAEADQKDVVLMVAPSRGRNGWAPGGVFNWATYESKVREFENDTMFRRAVNQRRMLLYVVDEPNHTDFGGTISPTEVNDMGLLHKEIWPGALTFVRMAGGPLRDGWDGPNGVNQPPPAGGYTGLDYGWLQYSAQRTDSTFAQVYAAERAILAGQNMGMVPGLNWWAGGIGHHGETTWDGVTACWQIDYPSSRLGYIVGIDQPAPHPPGEGDRYDCGQLPAPVTRTVTSPAWFRRWADVIYSDADAPIIASWRSADDAQTIPGAEALSARGDFISALDYVITKTDSRTTWNGYRTPK